MKRTSLTLTLASLFVLIFTLRAPLSAQDTTSLGIQFVDCPDQLTVSPGDSAYYRIQAAAVTTTKACPGIHYYLVSGPGWIDSLTGWWSFYPWMEESPLPPSYEVEVAAFFEGDTALSGERCRFTVNVEGGETPGYTVRIETVHDQLQGAFVVVSVLLESIDPEYGLGGFDLMIANDPEILTFRQALEGGLYEGCGWEYFTYMFDPYDDCAGCPASYVRVRGVAETINGDIHPNPDCQTTNPGYVGNLPATLFNMEYLVTYDRTRAGEFTPLRFFWNQCTDNTLTGFTGEQLFLSSEVYDFGNNEPINETEGVEFPTYLGAQEECYSSNAGTAQESQGSVVFYNGGVELIESGGIDAPGDININGIAYEIADALMFAHFFVEGLSAFGNHAEASTDASDVNRDDIPLTVEDFVYLLRVMLGDFIPYTPAPTPSPNPAYFSQDPMTGAVSVQTPDSLGAVLLVFDGEIGDSCLSPQGMEMMQGFDGEKSYVFMYTLEQNQFITAGEIFACAPYGQLIEARAATYDARPVVCMVGSPSQEYSMRIAPVDPAALGSTISVPVVLESFDQTEGLAGFELLITHDNDILTFKQALEGQLYEECGWEYFTYRVSPFSDCSACPPVVVQVAGIAETNNGDIHPNSDCQLGNPGWVGSVPITLCRIEYFVTSDSGYEGQFTPLRFFWHDCRNNALTDPSGEELLISANVYDFGSDEPINDATAELPTFLGAPEECLEVTTFPPQPPVRRVNFYNGGVNITGEPATTGYAVRIGADLGFDGGGLLDHTLAKVPVILDRADNDWGLSGFDLLMAYDWDALRFLRADEGSLLNHCGWEYFTYRYILPDSTSTGMTEALCQVVAIAETNDGVDSHPNPDCQVDSLGWYGDLPDTLCYLVFTTIFDTTTSCNFHPVSFYWTDCTDNLLTSTRTTVYGPDLYGSAGVYGYQSDVPINQTEGVEYPTFLGAQEECIDLPYVGPNPPPTRNVDFFNGGVQFACVDIIETIGDINDNGVNYEIADAVMFSWYFLQDTLAFGDHVSYSTYASDIDRDGTPLTVADFVLLVRTINGLRLPDDPAPAPSPNVARISHDPETGAVIVDTPDSLGALYMLFRGEVEGDCGPASGMAPACSYDGEYTRVFVYTLAPNKFISSGQLMTLGGDIELLQAEAATFAGARVATAIVNPDEGPLVVRIERAEDVIQGQVKTVDISLDKSLYEIGGFHLLLEYDPEALTVTDVNEGSFYQECNWEYFTYRFGPEANCGAACPAGYLQIIALGEHLDTLNTHPSCFLPASFPATLASVDFLVTTDPSYGGQFTPIRFYWYDNCQKNIFPDPSGSESFVARNVYDFDGTLIPRVDTFPAYAPVCPDPVYDFQTAGVDFYNGGISVAVVDTLNCDPGDLDRDGYPYRIADAVMYTNYFIEGWSAFGVADSACVLAASDVNEDGEPLTVADLIYLIRIIVGDAVPHEPPPASTNPTTIYDDEVSGSVYARTIDRLGGLMLLFEGHVAPESTEGPDVMYRYEGTNTLVYVSQLEQLDLTEGRMLFSYTGDGSLVDADAATIEGGSVPIILGSPTDVGSGTQDGLPTEFALGNNYPNPFNPSTKIEYDVPRSAHVEIAIFNVTGQRVRTLVDADKPAGSYTVMWNGTSEGGGRVASGMYFYRMSAGDYVKARKMILLK